MQRSNNNNCDPLEAHLDDTRVSAQRFSIRSDTHYPPFRSDSKNNHPDFLQKLFTGMTLLSPTNNQFASRIRKDARQIYAQAVLCKSKETAAKERLWSGEFDQVRAAWVLQWILLG